MTAIKTKTVGVIVGRFQTPYLHPGHQTLIATARSETDHLLILVGRRETFPDKRNPLDFDTCRTMINEYAEDARVRPIYDHSCDHAWSRQLDALIADEFPDATPVLYGSRDSFLPHYKGPFRTVEVPEVPRFSATVLREAIVEEPRHTEAFRAGMIYARTHDYPVSFQVVDVAIVGNPGDGTRPVLLGRKPGETKWRFVGGFVDPTDESLEHAAIREAHEEVHGADLSEFRYITSTRVHDWRYTHSPHGVMTAFFTAHYAFGKPKASDDLEEVRWFALEELADVLIDAHKELGQILISELT